MLIYLVHLRNIYLNCKTYFGFKYGTFSTQELVETAVEKGVTSLALTNINFTNDAWEFVKYSKEQKIKPVLGTEVRNGDKLLYLLIVSNNKGFGWINSILSDHLTAKRDFPESSEHIQLLENGDLYLPGRTSTVRTFMGTNPD